MSLRDKGNEHFKKERYEQALQCYEQYIEDDPNAQKKMAYCNISFCYFKMGRFQESIRAADDSIEEDQQYCKAYYRKMMAYKQMKGCEYDVFINATLLLKYNRAMDEPSKYDTLKTQKEYKQRWIAGLQTERQTKVKETSDLLELIDQANEYVGQTQTGSEGTTECWLHKWHNNSVSWEQNWVQIQQVASEEQELGINLAYLFCNQFKQPEFSLISQKVKQLKAKLSKKMDIEEVEEEVEKQEVQLPKEELKSSSEDENLFQSNNPSEKSEQSKPQHTIRNELSSNKQSPIVSSVNGQKINGQLTAKQESLPSKSQMQTEENNGQNQQNLTGQQIQQVYEKIKSSCFSERDVISGVQKAAQVILFSKFSRQTKGSLLQLLKQRNLKQMGKIRKSFTKEEQQKVYKLLVANGLEAYVVDFASRHLLK